MIDEIVRRTIVLEENGPRRIGFHACPGSEMVAACTKAQQALFLLSGTGRGRKLAGGGPARSLSQGLPQGGKISRSRGGGEKCHRLASSPPLRPAAVAVAIEPRQRRFQGARQLGGRAGPRARLNSHPHLGGRLRRRPAKAQPASGDLRFLRAFAPMLSTSKFSTCRFCSRFSIRRQVRAQACLLMCVPLSQSCTQSA